MRDRHARPFPMLLALAVLVAAAACESARSAPPPPISYEPVGELTGTWVGTWGGMPVTLLIAEHTEGGSYSGLYVGPWLVSGGRYPGLAGILTYPVSGAPTSAAFKGWIYSSRPLIVLTLAEVPDGQIHARLRGGGPGRLTGEAQSTFRWGPQGSVEMTRR